MSPHDWKRVTPSAGATSGPQARWVCTGCGAWGDAVTRGLGGHLRSYAYAPGTGYIVSELCDKAAGQIRAFESTGVVPPQPAGDPYIATALRLARTLARAGANATVTVLPPRDGWRYSHRGTLTVDGYAVEVEVWDGHVAVPDVARIAVRKRRRSGNHAPAQVAERVRDALAEHRRRNEEREAKLRVAAAAQVKLAIDQQVLATAPPLLRDVASFLRGLKDAPLETRAQAAMLLVRIEALVPSPDADALALLASLGRPVVAAKEA